MCTYGIGTLEVTDNTNMIRSCNLLKLSELSALHGGDHKTGGGGHLVRAENDHEFASNDV